MLTLYGFNISPYVAKVRAILRYKGLEFQERAVDPFDRRELKRLSGQSMVPVLAHDNHVVADSSRIARYLDDCFPARPVFPRDPKLQARALLLEEWADEGLPRVIQPVRWLIPANAERTLALFRSSYPPGPVEDLKFAAVSRILRWDQARKYGPRLFGRSRPSTILNRLAEVLDYVDAQLAETGFLVGDGPTVADFALYGFVHFLEGLDGWETAKARRRVMKLIKLIGEPTASAAEAPAEAYDSEDQALLDASRHRREKSRSLPIV